jgi:AcrR family transcriptional regulator
MAIQKSEITRERVLNATALLFARKGYLATSMRDVAANLGMKSGSLYYYYDSKEALLAAVLSQRIDQTLKALEAAVAALPNAASVRSQFRAAARENIKIIFNDGEMAVASARTMSLIAEPAYTELVEQRKKYNLFWRKLLISGKNRARSSPPYQKPMY